MHLTRTAIALGSMTAYMALGGCSSTPPIREGQLFSVSGIQFRVPAGTDWFKYQQDADDIYLETFGPGPGEVLSVGVHIGSMPPISGPDDFLRFARESALGGLPRWQSRQLEFQLRSDREYPCVLLHMTGDVFRHESIFGIFGTAHLRHENAISLLCQDPTAPHRTFAAAYQHIGDTLPERFEDNANAFIASVYPERP